MLEDNTQQFIPIREIETIRTDAWKQEKLTLEDEKIAVKAGDGVSFEWKLKIDLEQTDADRLEIELRSGKGRKTVCIFDFKKGRMTVDRNEADGWSKGISESTLYLKDKKELDIHILSDQSSVEIFADRYRNNHSLNVYAGNDQNKVYLCACGGKVAFKDLETYGLKECNR